jgi:molecular chaperone GrpE
VTDSSIEKKKQTRSKPKTKRRRSSREKELQKKLEATEETAKVLESRVAALEEQSSELRDDKLRLLAEMENARKRTERRIENERRAILVDFVKPLLDVADNLERAVRSAEENHNAEAIVEGVKMVQQHLVEVFTRFGITPIETKGQLFDYNVHEALGHAPSEEHGEDEIIAEVSRGYLLNGELLRPSKVIIARAPVEEQET